MRRSLRRDLGGASALEFALVAPVLLFAILGLIQLSLWLFASHSLNEALAAGARSLYFDTADTAGAMQTVREAAGGGYLDTTRLALTVTKLTSPYPRLELKAVYPFRGIGVFLPTGEIDMVAQVSVAIVED